MRRWPDIVVGGHDRHAAIEIELSPKPTRERAISMLGYLTTHDKSVEAPLPDNERIDAGPVRGLRAESSGALRRDEQHHRGEGGPAASTAHANAPTQR